MKTKAISDARLRAIIYEGICDAHRVDDREAVAFSVFKALIANGLKVIRDPAAQAPDANQLAGLIAAKATGTPIPKHARRFAPLVKSVKRCCLAEIHPFPTT